MLHYKIVYVINIVYYIIYYYMPLMPLYTVLYVINQLDTNGKYRVWVFLS